jgi:nucleoside-triphosphatase
MTPYKAFLTGDAGCGKTTIIVRVSELLEELGIRAGGVISREIRQNGVRVGFSLEDIHTNESGILAHIDQREGPRISKYRVNMTDLERIGARGVLRAVNESDTVVIDEIGPMELNSTLFINAVESALKSPKPLLGTIHKRATHTLVARIRSDPTCEVIMVDEESRDHLPLALVKRLTGETK